MSAANPLVRARLTGSHNDVRALLDVPRCTCTSKAMPSVIGSSYCCPCGWLCGDGLYGWTRRVADEIDYLGGQE